MLDPSELGEDAIRPLRRAEYDRMVEMGLFEEDEPLELLRGWLVRMSPLSPEHAWVVNRLTALLVPLVGDRATVSVQNSFALGDDSEPQPDLALIPASQDPHQHPSQAFLVVEVSDSSLRRDRRVKGRLYAEAGIPEYWIVNLPERCLEVHRHPSPAGYQRVERVAAGTIRLSAFADLEVPVDGLLPPR